MNGWLAALVVVVALLVSVFGGWGVAAGVLRLAARSSDAGRPEEEPGDVAGERRGDEPVPPGRDPRGLPATPASAAPGDADARADADDHDTADAPDDDAADNDDDDRRLDDSARSDGPVGPRAREALRGGTWIGILERVGVTGSLLVGDPTGIAVVVAIKGLGRFPELREHPAASERFVIGTLASLVFAAAVGVLGRALLLS